MKLKNFNLGKLFNNNRFLLVFSLVAAVLVWLFVSVEKSTDITRTLTNVPVQVDYARLEENFGLVPYGNDNFTVDITVSGKRYNVDNEQELLGELIVTANTGYVNSVGTYQLPITVESGNDRNAYTIDSWSLKSVEVYFDYPQEKEFAVTADIRTDASLVKDGYYAGEFTFGESKAVRVTGPETEVNKIKSVVARAYVETPLTQNTTLDAELVAVTRDGSTPNYISFNRQSTVAHITVPVYKLATLDVTVDFSGKPSDYMANPPFTVSIEPARAEFGVEESRLNEMDAFELSKIPFSSLTAGTNVIEIDAKDLTGGVVVNGPEKFKVTVVVNGMKAVTLTPPASLNFLNVPEGLSAQTESLQFDQITIVGPEADVEALTTDTIKLNADLSTVPEGVTGTVIVPVTVTGSNYWSYGEYMASVVLQ